MFKLKEFKKFEIGKDVNHIKGGWHHADVDCGDGTGFSMLAGDFDHQYAKERCGSASIDVTFYP